MEIPNIPPLPEKLESWDSFPYPDKVKKLAAEIVALNQFEMIMLTRAIQKTLGIPDMQLFGGGFGGGGGAATAGAATQAAPAEAPKPEPPKKEEEKRFYTLVLTGVPDDAKFKILKEVRVLRPGMKLMEVCGPCCLLSLFTAHFITSISSQRNLWTSCHQFSKRMCQRRKQNSGLPSSKSWVVL
jgi:ribosomal protein L7/L12